MNHSIWAVTILIISSVFVSVHSLHLSEARNVPDSLETPNNTISIQNRSDDSVADSGPSVKGNLGSLTSVITNPTQIINQLQSTVNKFIQTLNSTLNGKANITSSLLSSLTNITKPGIFRLEDADLLVANISEIVKNSKSAESLSNSTDHLDDQVHGVLEDFQKSIMELRSSVQASPDNLAEEDSVQEIVERKSENAPSSAADENASSQGRSRRPSGLPRTLFDQLSSLRTQVDHNIKRSISDARYALEDSLQVARQNSQVMRNQTFNFMGEVQKVFNEFSAPIRNFFEALRRGRPTAVVTA